MQEEQKKEETQLGVGPAAKFSKGKTRGRKDERDITKPGTCWEVLGTRKRCGDAQSQALFCEVLMKKTTSHVFNLPITEQKY